MEDYTEHIPRVVIDQDEEEPTQPATQPVMDPRRLGQHSSGMTDENLADIILILHPASINACRAISLIADEAPEHTIAVSDVELKVRHAPISNTQEQHRRDEPETFELAARGITSHDIALRLSANLKNPLQGFQFGRNPQRCDFVLTEGGNIHTGKRVSNVHFRIYVNEHGTIMLEDTSTNGTCVEGKLLHGTDKENKPFRHMLDQGTLIRIPMTPSQDDFDFLVRIPRRSGPLEDLYNRNLSDYFENLRYLHNEKEAERGALTQQQGVSPVPGPASSPRNPWLASTNLSQPDLFRFGNPGVGTSSMSVLDSRIRRRKEWKGGDKYNKGHTLGKGAFATVYALSDKYDGTMYAAKELEKRRFMKNGILDQKVEQEMTIMRKIKHPHIVQYIEHVDWDEYLYLIMEMVPGGDLSGLVFQYKRLPEHMVRTIADQMLSALDYLHSQNITHRDVKPDNILIASTNPISVKLTDFGLSKVVENDETFMRTFCGTLLYCAPEVYAEYREYDTYGMRSNRQRGKENLPPLPPQKYGHGVDVYSLGAVLFYALCGSPPYPAQSGTTYQELLHEIMTRVLDIRPLQRAGVSEVGIKFVKEMLQVHPDQRSTVKDLQYTQWIRGSASMSSYNDEEAETEHEGASQLSLGNRYQEYVDDDEDEVQLILAGASQMPQTASQSSLDESFAFLDNNKEKAPLFGEVNASAIGSSGVIPRSHLNLQFSHNFQPTANPSFSTTATSPRTSIDRGRFIAEGDDMDDVELTGPHEVPSRETTPAEGGRRVVDSLRVTTPRTSTGASLMGAESLVGALRMTSPSPGPMSPPPNLLSHIGQLHEQPKLTESVRRVREEETTENSRPDNKRRKSERHIDLTLSKKTFWGKDRSTWHENYPSLTLSEYNDYEELAKARGEAFEHGQKTFDDLMARHTAIAEKAVIRAESEPLENQGRRQMLKRDTRAVSEFQIADSALPQTTQNSQVFSTGTATTFANTSATAVNSISTVDHELPNTQTDLASSEALPAGVWARLKTTPNSAVHVSLDITKNVTTWGRGAENTNHFLDRDNVKIPKYGLKIVVVPASTSDHLKGRPAKKFYVGTKASADIRVNGVPLKASDSRNPRSPWKNYGEIFKGDVINLYKYQLNVINLVVEGSSDMGQRRKPFEVVSIDIASRLDALSGTGERR